MTPREIEARWKERLRQLAVEQQTRTRALEQELETRVREVEQRARLMVENTLKHCDEMQKARVAAYERETQRLLEQMRQEAERCRAEAASMPMDAELSRVWFAMNEEEETGQ